MHVQGQERSIGTCSEDRLEVVPDKNSVCPTERAKNITEDEVRKDGRVEVTVYKWVKSLWLIISTMLDFM